MGLTTSAVNLIGRHAPEIFDLLGNPDGPLVRVGAVARRADAVALNPQPLPPGLRAGLLAAAELLRTASTADRLGVEVRFDLDDWCGTPPRRPPFVWPPAPWPPADPRGPSPDPWAEYHLGLALGLEAAAHLWEALAGADQVTGIHDRALETAAGQAR